MKERTVIYLSSCAVDGKGAPDPFLLQELPWLRRHFQRVFLVSYYGTADVTDADAEDLVKIQSVGSFTARWKGGLRALLAGEFWREMGRMRRERGTSLTEAAKLFLFTLRGQKLHVWLEGLLRHCDASRTTLYAYWMSYEAYAAALSKGRRPGLRFVTRGHAFEIDPGRNLLNPYLMKRFIAEKADGLYFISHYAKEQYLRYMGGVAAEEKVHVVGVGSKGEAIDPSHEPPFFATGSFRVVSCATMNEIKQIPLWIDALARWKGPKLHWLHMGGGSEEETVRAYAEQRLGGHEWVSYEITGRISNEQVQRAYEDQAFDLFINTSRLEGVPVSIMEALRVGIPVAAPRVGGIPELVDEKVGMLYEPEDGEAGILQALAAFVALPYAQVMELRQNAQKRWYERCRMETLLPLLLLQDEAETRREEA